MAMAWWATTTHSRQQRFHEHTVWAGCWSRHWACNSEQTSFLCHQGVDILEIYLHIVAHVPDIVLRTSPILPYLSPQPCTVSPVLEKKKLKLGDFY